MDILIVWFLKISIPPLWRELEIAEGVGVGGSKTQEIPEERGVVWLIWFLDAITCYQSTWSHLVD